MEVLYALFRRYQPGGLAERSRLLRQLVEPKTPQTMNEVVEALRGWRRSLRRAQELEIATPDATLLLGALDRMSELVGRTSSQVAFRMSSTRAALGVDVTPSLETVLNFSDTLTAEAESLAISELQPVAEVKTAAPMTKVKATAAVTEEKGDKGAGKTKADAKVEEKICRFWGSEEGCRKGQDQPGEEGALLRVLINQALQEGLPGSQGQGRRGEAGEDLQERGREGWRSQED